MDQPCRLHLGTSDPTAPCNAVRVDVEAPHLARHRSTPTVGGYATAIWISYAVFVLECGALSLIEYDPSSSPLSGVLTVAAFALAPAWILGPIGATAVHFATRRLPSQVPAVLGAAVAGFAAGLILENLRFELMLALACAVGRLAIGPAVKRAARAERP